MLEFQLKKDDRNFSNEDREEFKNICRPVVEYLQEHYGASHVKAIISCEYAELVRTQKGVPFKFLEQGTVHKNNSA